jgi:FkbM family methyltransferase
MINGSFIYSSRNISLNRKTNILSCELASIHNEYILNKKKIQENKNYDNINGVLTPENYENSYFITACNQLGNCLRIILSGLIIAEANNKHPFILFYYLAEKEKKVINSLFREYVIYNNVDFIQMNYNDAVNYENFYGTNYDLICEGKIKNIEEYNKCGIINTIYSIIPENMSEEEYIIKKIKIYKSLILPNELINNINSFIINNNLSNCVGIHIRYTDNLTDYCKNNNNFNTSLDIFKNKINSINEKILLCSDSKEVINYFKSNNNNNIIFANNCFDNNFQGFYEMCLLSNCKYIIGTTSSTFSYEAAFIKGTNIELYINNEWKKYELEKYRCISYSQLGQDLEVIKFYNNKENGYFIEIGASDGLTLSNTYLLESRYKWKGICCEPIPDNFEKLVKNRKNSICYKEAVYNQSGLTVTFDIAHNFDLLSGISDHIDRHKPTVDSNKTIIEVQTISLLDVLDKANAPSFIEYMSLDTEGSELEILKNFDFNKYTFGLIDVEHNYIEPRRSEIKRLLLSKGYIYTGQNEFDDMYKHSSVYHVFNI